MSRGSASVRGPAIARGGTTFSGGSRVYAQSRGGVVTRGAVAVPRGSIGVRGGVVTTRGAFVSPVFARPYYTFRPRVSIGFGLWAGYPVAFPYYGYGYGYYGYPYGYAYPYPYDPYAYGYAAPSYGYPSPYAATPYSGTPYSGTPYSGTAPYNGSDYPATPDTTAPGTSVQPSAPSGEGQQQPGGASFEITPDSAAVFVDGTYVGTAGTFNPNSMPLGLIPGRHHIEIRASGYRTMTFDVDIVPGQVVPYRGTMERQ